MALNADKLTTTSAINLSILDFKVTIEISVYITLIAINLSILDFKENNKNCKKLRE